jgi:two-component system response regulator AtoC
METANFAEAPSAGGRWMTVREPSAMTHVRAMAARAARSNISVMLLGETGVGKEVLAQAIHESSPRAARPFVAINCGGMNATLLDSELFGHEKNAFTGAAAAKIGLVEAADGGTLFLDEIGDMPSDMQAKLLRVLETREVRPLGGLRSRPVDVRFLAATNVDIEVAVANGTFRADLMYRLNTLTLTIPPLRERTDELPGLVETLLARVCHEGGRERLEVSPEAMSCLYQHHWAGNIRELLNVIDRAVVFCDGPTILPRHLQLQTRRVPQLVPFPGGPAPAANDGAERTRIVEALDACGRNQTRAARLLGISRRTLITRLDFYKLPRPTKGYQSGAASAQGAL